MAKNIFNSVKRYKLGRSFFDLTHDIKFSLDMGELVPFVCIDCIPGDKHRIAAECLVKFAPLIAPLMHRIDVTMHYFFVPYRLLWDAFTDYVTDPRTVNPHPFITVAKDGSNYDLLHDYFGVPRPADTTQEKDEDINALPFAAYQLIFNEYYRSQDLQNEVPFKLIDGDNNANTELWGIRRRGWEHDYFTAALPFAQKGDAVSIPIAGFNDVAVLANRAPTPGVKEEYDNTNTAWVTEPDGVGLGASNIRIPLELSDDPTHMTDLYAATSDLVPTEALINDLRTAFKLQMYLEANARFGTRYAENLYGRFGVRPEDARLQRPEYIVGVKSPVVISEILNTSGNDALSLPQGNMSGHAASVATGKYGSYYCKEHGCIIGIMSVMPKTAYYQGLPKHLTKINDMFDYFNPEFANIGEQPVLNKEIMAFTGDGTDTFGYVPRYSEYKYQPSRVAGDFRGSLAFWQLARKFDPGAGTPVLNDSFIKCIPRTDIFAVETGTQHLWAHVLHKGSAVRSMPKYGTPGGV